MSPRRWALVLPIALTCCGYDWTVEKKDAGAGTSSGASGSSGTSGSTTTPLACGDITCDPSAFYCYLSTNPAQCIPLHKCPKPSCSCTDPQNAIGKCGGQCSDDTGLVIIDCNK